MTDTVCICKYPLHVIDKRNGDEVEYLAFPLDFLEEMGGQLKVPDIEPVKEEDFDGIIKDYIKITWADPTNALTKKYDVHNHLVWAGCDLLEANGEVVAKCESKEIYVVLHPEKEWGKQHIVELD